MPAQYLALIPLTAFSARLAEHMPLNASAPFRLYFERQPALTCVYVYCAGRISARYFAHRHLFRQAGDIYARQLPPRAKSLNEAMLAHSHAANSNFIASPSVHGIRYSHDTMITGAIIAPRGPMLRSVLLE